MQQNEFASNRPNNPTGRLGRSSKRVDWRVEATRFLKSLLAREGLTVADLVEKLAENGEDEKLKTLQSRIGLGTMSVACFMQCMNAIHGESPSISVDVKSQTFARLQRERTGS